IEGETEAESGVHMARESQAGLQDPLLHPSPVSGGGGGGVGSPVSPLPQGIYILIAVGAVMMFVGFLGCYGAIQESQCLLGTFFTCLVILFACEVAAGIWGFVNKDQIAKDVKQFYDQALQQAVVDDDANNAKAVVKTFHETLDCCGSNTLSKLTTSVLKNNLCPSGNNLIGTLFKEDCHQKIDELFSGKLYLIGIAAIVVAVIMIFEMILSMVLCCGIRNSSVY
uniref:CD81 molecule n=1 Tax=Microcebus murinus TaxID=30608 RepID=A0A8C5XQ49_MICMU